MFIKSTRARVVVCGDLELRQQSVKNSGQCKAILVVRIERNFQI